MLWIDFETASECDLPSRGVYNYARDPSTRVLCMAWSFHARINGRNGNDWREAKAWAAKIEDRIRESNRVG